MEVTVTIHDEFVGDIDVPCEVIGATPADVMYDEAALASKLEMLSVPLDVDEDVKVRAIEELIYSDEEWDNWEQAREDWEAAV